MPYPRDEQETTLVYEAVTNEWMVYSTVPRHISRLKKITQVTELEHDDNGRIKAVKAKLSAKQVSMVSERVLTKQQKEEAQRRMAFAREKLNNQSEENETSLIV